MCAPARTHLQSRCFQVCSSFDSSVFVTVSSSKTVTELLRCRGDKMYSGDGKNGSRGGGEESQEGDALSNVQLLKRGNQSRQANSAAKTSLQNTNMHHVSFMNAICFNLTLDEQGGQWYFWRVPSRKLKLICDKPLVCHHQF